MVCLSVEWRGKRVPEVIIRRAQESDIEQVSALLGDWYGRSPDSFARRIRDDPAYRPDLSLVVCRADRVLSHARIVPRELRVGGVRIKVAGIAESITERAERGRGHTPRLAAAVRDMAAAEGCELALGWTHRREFLTLSGVLRAPTDIVPTDITEITTGAATDAGVRPFDEADLPAVSRLYDQANTRRSGTTVRTPAYWRAQRRLFDGETFLVAESAAGVVSGYVRVMAEEPVDRLLELAAEQPGVAMELLSAAAPRGRLSGALPGSLRDCLPATAWSIVPDGHLVAGVLNLQAVVDRLLPIWCERAGTRVKAEVADGSLQLTAGAWAVEVPVSRLARLLLLGSSTGQESVLFPPQDFVIWESDRI